MQHRLALPFLGAKLDPILDQPCLELRGQSVAIVGTRLLRFLFVKLIPDVHLEEDRVGFLRE